MCMCTKPSKPASSMAMEEALCAAAEEVVSLGPCRRTERQQRRFLVRRLLSRHHYLCVDYRRMLLHHGPVTSQP